MFLYTACYMIKYSCDSPLIGTLAKVGNFSYHLLSGIDMPIKTQQYIQSFFTKNNGKEFVGFYTLDENWIDRVCKYHFFTKFFRYEGRFKIVIDSLRDLTEKIANNLSHRNKDMDIFKKGCNWCSISNKFCAYLISKEGEIKRRFHHTFCADEVFIQTILWNSPFKKNVYSTANENVGSLREIDWTRGKPYTWGGKVRPF